MQILDEQVWGGGGGLRCCISNNSQEVGGGPCYWSGDHTLSGKGLKHFLRKALLGSRPPGLTPSPLPSLVQMLHYKLPALTVFSQSPCHKGNVHTMLDPL